MRFILITFLIMIATVTNVAQESPLSGLTLFDIELEEPFIYSATLNADESTLVAVGDSVFIIDTETGEILHNLEGGGLSRVGIWSVDENYFAIILGVGFEDPSESDLIDSIEVIYETENWEEVDIPPSSVEWTFSIPTAILTSSGCVGDTNQIAISDNTTLTLGDPVRITGNRSATLGAGSSGVSWYQDSNQVVIWDSWKVEVWDLETDMQLIQGIHFAPDMFTCSGGLLPPTLTNTHLITLTYSDARTLYPGVKAEVYVEDDGLSLRASPSISGNLIRKLPKGTQITVVGDSVDADGYTWWEIEDPSGNIGYSVEGADGLNTLNPVLPFDGNVRIRVYEIEQG